MVPDPRRNHDDDRGSSDPGQPTPGSIRPCRILQDPARPFTQTRVNAKDPALSCRILHPGPGQCGPAPAGSCKIGRSG
eukprot:4775938-Pyramimonas_sp.AAC.1